jgi:hypothetical protein
VAADSNLIRIPKFSACKDSQKKKSFSVCTILERLEYESFQQKRYTIAVRKSKKEERLIV